MKRINEAITHDSEKFRAGLGAFGIHGLDMTFHSDPTIHKAHTDLLVQKQTIPYFKKITTPVAVEPFHNYTFGAKGFNTWLHSGKLNDQFLRTPEAWINEYKNRLEYMHKGFKMTEPVPIGMVTYSGISPEHGDYIQQHKPGETVDFKAVTSSSPNPAKAFNFSMVKGDSDSDNVYHSAAFHLEKGLPKTAFYIGPRSRHPSEEEMIIRPGMKATYTGSELFKRGTKDPYGGDIGYMMHHFTVHPHEDQ